MEGRYLHKTSCPACGSSDANAVYDNGDKGQSTYCFSCEVSTRDYSGTSPKVATGTNLSKLLGGGEYQPLADRGITVDTCRHYGYQVHDTYKDECLTHIAPYFSTDGDHVGQHLRFEGDKGTMPWRWANKDKPRQMFGQQKFANSGNRLVICEGEIDAMSVYQALGSSWPCVGIAGANLVDKVLKANLEFIESFDEIILFFDNDEAGKKATKAALEILPFGKAKYVNEFPSDCKDANDILVKHGAKALRNTTFYKVAEYQPEGITDVKDIKFDQADFNVSMFPWDGWNKKLFARRSGELTVYTAGSGVGKSTILRSIYNALLQAGESCAGIFLEETVAETKADLLSGILGKPVRKILAQQAINAKCLAKGLPILFEDAEELDSDALERAEKELDKTGMILIDHSKGYNLESILSHMRFLAISRGVKHILLDHISLLISSDSEIDNEVKATDVVMKKLRILAESTGINIDIISHIRKGAVGSKSVNKGAEISLESLRGSGSLYQVANNVISLERDQQDDDAKNTTICRSLKSRMGGYTGIINKLRYIPETGQLKEEAYEESHGDTGFKAQTSY